MIRALIVDDEPPARLRLRTLLADQPDVEVVGECGDGATALELIRRLSPDLVFLDVQMPEMDGLAVVEALGGAPPGIVFVTAYDVHAVRAFELHALDYLLKPVDGERFARTLERFRRQPPGDWSQRLERFLADHAAVRRRLERLIVREPGRVHVVRLEEIDWIEAAGNYVQIHAAGAVHLCHERLTAMAARLPTSQFRRIHRSVLVNVDRIRQIDVGKRGDGRVLLADGTRLTLSRTYRAALADLL